MNKVLISLLVLAIIGTAQCESFKRVHFDQGKAHFERNLETAKTPVKVGLAGNLPNQTVVDVKILEEFLKNNTQDLTVNTSMAIYLSSSETGFCDGCDGFVVLDCLGECKKGSENIGIMLPRNQIGYAHQIMSDASFVTLGESWKLTTRPLIFDSRYVYGQSIPTKNSYGVLGLGTEGNARANFQGTDSPVFSVSVNSTGKGSLIFGNDTTLVKKGQYLKWNTSGNWVAESSNIYYKTKAITYKTNVHFDLNQIGSNFSVDQFASIVIALNLTYNSTAPGNGYQYYYNATDKGPITKQPGFIMTIDGGNVTIPLEALLKKHEDPKTPNIYTFLANAISWRNNYNITNHPSEQSTVFGSYFLSNFYAVFSAPKDKVNVVELFPNYTPFTDSGSSSSSGGSGGKFLIGLIAVIGLGAVGFIVFRNKAASKLQEHLNEK